MSLMEDITRRIEYGNSCMKRLSELSIKDIITRIEEIWGNSCSASNRELIKEYHTKKILVEYNSNLEIQSVKISWFYWDNLTIELSSMGLVAIYKPEHGSHTKLLDLTWILVKPFF